MKPLRVLFLVIAFLVALDACIAINRWWLEAGFRAYLENLIIMVGGFTLFIILISKSKRASIGYIFLCVAVYFICNYEIGGPSKYYLTPFDPAFDLAPAFPKGEPLFAGYRKVMAIITSILAASVLAVSRLKRQAQKAN